MPNRQIGINAKKRNAHLFTCWFSQVVAKFRTNGIGTICGRFFIGTAEKIPDSELVDTTGAGDAFIGAIIYGRGSLCLLYIFSIVPLSDT